MICLKKSYFQHQLKTKSKYYKEALLSIRDFEKKGIKNINDWDKEHIFYNPLFLTEDGKTISITKYCEQNKVWKYEQLLKEKEKENKKLPFNKTLTNMLSKIYINTSIRQEDVLVKRDEEEIQLNLVSQKQLYEEAIVNLYRDHHSQVKWATKLGTSIPWEDVWKAVHHFLPKNKTKSVIWQQIHLNFYTQYSYNKWHNKNKACPLCKTIPESVYHLILHCPFVNKLWEDLEPVLKELHHGQVTDEEKAFGIIQRRQTIGTSLRNWLTYLLRQSIAEEERAAFYANKADIKVIKQKFNYKLENEIREKELRYKNENNSAFFDKVIAHEQILCKKGLTEEYEIRKVLTT